MTTVDPANASELAEITREVGADLLMGGLDLGECRARFRGQRQLLIIAPVGDAPSPTHTCGIGDQCAGAGKRAAGPHPDVLDQVRDLLDRMNGANPDQIGNPRKPEEAKERCREFVISPTSDEIGTGDRGRSWRSDTRAGRCHRERSQFRAATWRWRCRGHKEGRWSGDPGGE